MKVGSHDLSQGDRLHGRSPRRVKVRLGEYCHVVDITRGATELLAHVRPALADGPDHLGVGPDPRIVHLLRGNSKKTHN